MKNIHVLPTDKPSRIYLIKSNNKLGITSNNPEFTENFGSGTQNQHIYITSDEEIKDIRPHGGKWQLEKGEILNKVIMTTDQDLIKNGVQAIDDEFLNWFVKNPSCEEVEIDKMHLCIQTGLPCGMQCLSKETCNENINYKIIIPKEEPKQHLIDMMQDDEELGLYDIFNDEKRQGVKELIDKHKQETIREVVQRYYEDNIDDSNIPRDYYEWEIQDLMIGFAYQWEQQRSYSEEEVLELLLKSKIETSNLYYEDMKEWFELNKKK